MESRRTVPENLRTKSSGFMPDGMASPYRGRKSELENPFSTQDIDAVRDRIKLQHVGDQHPATLFGERCQCPGLDTNRQRSGIQYGIERVRSRDLLLAHGLLNRGGSTGHVKLAVHIIDELFGRGDRELGFLHELGRFGGIVVVLDLAT